MLTRAWAMFHAAVFVMMSRRLSDQSEIDHHEMPTQNCPGRRAPAGRCGPARTLDDVPRRQASEACPEPAPGNAFAGWEERRWRWRLDPHGCLTRGSAGGGLSRIRTDEGSN